MDPFTSSAGASTMKDLVGELVLFTPVQWDPPVNTKFGDVTPLRCNLVVLTEGGHTVAPAEARNLDGVAIMNSPVIREVGPKLGNTKTPMHLGRVGEVPNKKGGQSPVIVLDSPSTEDRDTARAYLAALVPADPFA